MRGTMARPAMALTVAAALSVTGCAGSGSSGSAASTGATGGAGTTTAGTAAPTSGLLAPAAFADAVADPATFVLNVHVPDAGSIAGTDAAIPYDRIRTRAAELPQNRSTTIAVYCRSGRMSAEAVPVLAELGYTDVVELRGGMNAWVADGRELLPPAG